MSQAQEPPPLETPLRWHVGALLFAMLLPSAATFMYFVLFAGNPAVQAVYGACKVVQFAFPLVWVLAVQGRKIQFAKTKGVKPWLWGLGVGGLVSLAGLAAYWGYFKHSPWLAETPELVRQKIVEMKLATPPAIGASGLGSPMLYILFGLFVMAPHAALEEYYWRWFVFGQLRRVVPTGWAITASSLAFMAHHVIVLQRYFQEQWAATAFFSLCVAVGGAIWAWLYNRQGSLYGPWVSHMLVDATIFGIGYDLAWRSL